MSCFCQTKNVLPLIEEQIAAGKSVKLRVRGNSMFPRLDGRPRHGSFCITLIHCK